MFGFLGGYFVLLVGLVVKRDHVIRVILHEPPITSLMVPLVLVLVPGWMDAVIMFVSRYSGRRVRWKRGWGHWARRLGRWGQWVVVGLRKWFGWKSFGWRGRRSSILGGTSGVCWWGWVPEPTPIPISTDSLVPHRPAQLGVTMGAFQSCAGLHVGAG
jgi:hypothetical protein